MSSSPRHPDPGQTYSLFRRSFIERHICRNGRVLEEVILVERAADGTLPLLDPVCRTSEELVREDIDRWRPLTYDGYPLLYPSADVADPSAFVATDDDGPHNFYIAGGGDNPLLRGGLALATFSIEVLLGVGTWSYEYARRLFAFLLASEARGDDDSYTGIMLRRRNVSAATQLASVDELCGLILGLYFFALAATERGEDADRTNAQNLLRHVGDALKRNDYNLGGRGAEWIFQWPFGRVFKEITGYAEQSDRTVPYLPDGATSVTATLAKTLVAALSLDLEDLATGDTVDASYTPLDLFDDWLDKYPDYLRGVLDANGVTSLVTASTTFETLDPPQIKLAFFNATMGAHALLMSLLPAGVDGDARRRIAEAGNELFRDLCYGDDALLEPSSGYNPGERNVYFGLVAQRCLREMGDPVDDQGWRSHVGIMWLPLERTEAYWLPDLPCAPLGDAAPFADTAPGWGEAFTWEHPDPAHSFLSPPRLWTSGDVTKHLGISAAELEALDADKLAPVYAGAADPSKGLRVETCGLDLLFPRMLAAYLQLTAPPLIDDPVDAPIASLPCDGPAPGGRFAGNHHTKKVHDLTRLRPECNYDEITEEHLRSFFHLVDAHRMGYDNCDWCFSA